MLDNGKPMGPHLSLPWQCLGRFAAQHRHERVLDSPVYAGRHSILIIPLTATSCTFRV